MGEWTFFSNYGHVLVCLARNRDARLRDVADEVGITERAVQKIVRDMQDAGFLTVTKQGRCNRYRINRRKSLRHGLESHCTVGRLLTLIGHAERTGEATGEPTVVPSVVPGVVPSGEPAVERAVETGPEVADSPDTAPAEPDPAAEKDSKKKQSPDVSREQGSLF